MGKPLYSIQAARAAAATLVVISHLSRSLLLKAGTDVTGVTTLGGAGVDLFFVVSGFIMVPTTIWPFHAGQFMRQRLACIAPLHWLATLLCVAIVLTLPELFHFYHFNLHSFLMAFAFLPSYSTASDILPPLQQSWTLVDVLLCLILVPGERNLHRHVGLCPDIHVFLRYELQGRGCRAFARHDRMSRTQWGLVLFAVTSKLAFSRRICRLGLIFSMLVGVCLASQPTQNALALTYANPILFEFLAGCALAGLIRGGQLPIWTLGAVALIGAAIVGFAESSVLTRASASAQLWHAGFGRATPTPCRPARARARATTACSPRRFSALQSIGPGIPVEVFA
jgi:peptidoglycan/LPS O-acetylase OafA/YrhL